MSETNRYFEINKKYEEKGVIFIDKYSVYILGDSVNIGKGTIIYPNVVIEGDTEIGKNCIIGMSSRIKDSAIADDVEVWQSVILESKIGRHTKVGPFAYLRPNSNIGDKCKIGDFVEVKNSNFGEGSKASHLTYIGDADVGKNVNLGCGVVFVNYNGRDKNRTIVEDGAFVGCNSNLVSPIRIEKESYVAAGSTVVVDVPKGSLHVARSKGKTIHGWVKKRGLIKTSDINKGQGEENGK